MSLTTTLARLPLLAIGFTLLSNLVQAEPQAYWPQFHGPNRNNISTETGLLKEWPADGPKLLWTANGLGYGYSSVSMADGRMYHVITFGQGNMASYAAQLSPSERWQAILHIRTLQQGAGE